jgi:hypothetical protein
VTFGVVTCAMKLTLMMLLRYQGYMFETRGKNVSVMTQIWGLMMKGEFVVHARFSMN